MIQITQVNKSFGEHKVSNNVDIAISKGEIFGLLGPNGAGKSTLINMLSGVLSYDSGTISLDGMDMKSHAIQCKKNIGIVPQEISLYDNFSAYDNLLFFGKLYGIEVKTLKESILEILSLIGLEDRKDDLIKTYSGGMKRRVNIAVALLHQPKILLMDEPTVGVDPQSRNQIFDIVEALNKKGMTIVYTTHYMEEVERLCDRIAILDHGNIIAQGSLAELQNQSKAKELLEIGFEDISATQLDDFKSYFDFEVTAHNNQLKIYCNIKKELNNIMNYAVKHNLIIIDVNRSKATLESVFLELTGRSLRD